MKTHFKKLRRCYNAAAIVCPIACFAAFLCFAGGLSEAWTWILLMFALFYYTIFPFGMVPEGRPRLKGSFLFVLNPIALWLCYRWVILVADLGPSISKLSSEQALLSWELITAAGIWAGLAIYKNLLFINGLSDEMIFNYLNRGDSDKTDSMQH